MKAVELFSGAGGLGMGVGMAAFEHVAVIEWDGRACATIAENKRLGFPLVSDWPVFETDVRLFDFSQLGKIDLVAAGPPCQPFSLGGRHAAFLDRRDMFPATVDIVRTLLPKAFLIENVKGLAREKFHNYFQYIKLQLEYPFLVRGSSENVLDHLSRLERCKTSGETPQYEVISRVINAADYGIPQKRERIFLVGFRHDLGVEWSFPEKSHSYESLMKSLWINGDYWDRHKVPISVREQIYQLNRRGVDRFRSDYHHELISTAKPWRTVRDAFYDLPEPSVEGEEHIWNHKLQPGARQYHGHTGSPLDLPAKTIKAGVHGVPGGENMLLKPNGEVRYFTVRETARLQTFPDGYVFRGAWSESMRQLGNAVPVMLARTMAASVMEKLVEAETKALLKQVAGLRQ